MDIKLIIAAGIIIIVLYIILRKKKPDGREIFREILKKAVKTGGIFRTDDLKSFRNIEMSKQYLNKMYKDGVLTINVVDKTNMEYMFPAIPSSYNPVKVENLENFNSSLFDKGVSSEDGQVFLSEIVFAFDMDYADIIEAFEMYSKNEWVMKNISKSGNVYLMFDKAEMQV